MKLLAFAIALFLSLVLAAPAQSPEAWLALLNAQPGREQKLTQSDVVFRPAVAEGFTDLVSAGFRQSDGTFALGCLIWQGKVWSPLSGYAQILQQKGFAEATDEERAQLFLSLLEQSNALLGIFPYSGGPSREENRPQPISGYRQVDGQHRFVVWFGEEPGTREGPEWRQVLYLISMVEPSVQARTLSTFHPVAEGLRGFPAIRPEPSE
jgi:hypothetical protein